MSDEFDALYRHHAPAAFRRAQRLLDDHAAAHAVVFEVFDALYDRPAEYAGSTGMSTFVYGAATHACLKRLRKQQASARERDEERAAAGLAPRAAAAAPDRDARVRALAMRVPAQLDDYVIYHYMDELSHAEIAHVLERSFFEVDELPQYLEGWERENACSPLPRTRAEACPSDLLLDALAAEDLADKVVQQLSKHLAQCTRCQTQRVALDAARATYLEDAPSFDVQRKRAADAADAAEAAEPEAAFKPVAKRRPHHQRTWLARAVAFMALVAIGVALMRHSKVTPAARGQSVPTLGFVIERAGQVMRGSAEALVQADDRVRFTYSSDRDVYLALLRVGAPRARSYYPTTGTQAASARAGSDVQLDPLQLDGNSGIEQVVGVFCRAPFEITPLLAALDAARELPHVGDCHVDELQLKKQPARP